MKWVMSVIHLFPSHLSNEQVHSAGRAQAVWRHHRTVTENLRLEVLVQKGGPNPLQAGLNCSSIVLLRASWGPAVKLFRVGMTASLALVAKIYHSYFDVFFMCYQNFPCYSSLPLLLDFVFHERTTKNLSLLNKGPKAKTQECERHCHSLVVFT